ncbi:MAG: glycine zipper family protein [Pseudoxanthomonas sp.]
MRSSIIFTMTLAMFFSGVANAQKPSAYPSKGQTAQQQATDDSQCLAWAKQDTGIDPAAVAAAPVATTGPQGERLRGAVRGAAAGAVVGEIVDDDASKGAGVGATAGVLAGGRRARQNQAAQTQQAQAAKSQSIDTYYRAYGACMTGRGYSVK